MTFYLRYPYLEDARSSAYVLSIFSYVYQLSIQKAWYANGMKSLVIFLLVDYILHLYRKLITELRSITCHTGSHSVTCYLT